MEHTQLWVTNNVTEEDDFDERNRTFFPYRSGMETGGYDIWTDEQKQQWEQAHPLTDE